MQVADALDDRKPQARPAEAAGDIAVDLAEGRERLLDIGGRDADAGIGDGEDRGAIENPR